MHFYHYHTKNHSSQQLTVIVGGNNKMPSTENSTSLEITNRNNEATAFPKYLFCEF